MRNFLLPFKKNSSTIFPFFFFFFSLFGSVSWKVSGRVEIRYHQCKSLVWEISQVLFPGRNPRLFLLTINRLNIGNGVLLSWSACSRLLRPTWGKARRAFIGMASSFRVSSDYLCRPISFWSLSDVDFGIHMTGRVHVDQSVWSAREELSFSVEIETQRFTSCNL